MKRLTILSLLLTVLLTSGCASITRGTKDAFAIESSPPGASATLSNGLSCTTPCAMELPRKHAFTVTFAMEGYKPVTANVIPRQAGAGSAGMAGNVLFGGLIGAAVDAGSGAMKDLYPNPLVVTLVEESSTEESVVDMPEGEEPVEAADVEEAASADADDTIEGAY